MKSKTSKAEQPCTSHSVRVRFYLCDFDEDIWAVMPCRINAGLAFYIDDFVSADDEKRLRKETVDYLYYDGSILECNDFTFGRDKQGVYQLCHLTRRP